VDIVENLRWYHFLLNLTRSAELSLRKVFLICYNYYSNYRKKCEEHEVKLRTFNLPVLLLIATIYFLAAVILNWQNRMERINQDQSAGRWGVVDEARDDYSAFLKATTTIFSPIPG
jgi:hypothetical protein